MAKYYVDKYGKVTANQNKNRTLKYSVDEYGNVTNNLSLPQTTAKKKPKYTMDADGNIRLTVEPIKEEKEEKVVETTSKKEKDTWFKSGAFGDGKGNILTDTALTYWSTIGDAYLNAGKGIVGMVEGVADLGMYGAGAVADLVGADGVAESVRGAAKKNTTDAIYSPAEKLVDKYSVLGNKADNVSKGVGQAVGIIATAGAGAAAGLSSTASTILTTGVNFLSSAGSGMSEAYADGATDKEAAIYGGIKGGIDAGTELLFGGLGKAANATGLSRGIGGLDDMAADALTKKITNQLVKNSAKYAFKSAGEGVEEVIAGALTAKAKQIYSEEEYSTLLEDENLLEQFIVGSLVGGIVSTPSLVQSNISGRDYTSGLTTNEQKVVDAEVKRRIEAQETDGKKLSKKEQAAIREEVQYNLKKGYISTDVIESTLAGESEAYKNYQSVTKQEQVLEQKIKDIEKDETLTATQKNELTNAFKKEIEALNKKQVVGKFVTEMDALTEKDNYLRESYNELGRSKENFTADLSKYNDKEKEVIQAAMDSEVAGNSNQTHEFVDKLAKIYSEKGIFFKLTNTEKIREEGRDVEGATVNGYVTEDGVVVLNVDSMKSLNTIVGHEITHTFEKNGVQDPELQNFVIELSKIRGDYDTKWQQIQNSYSDERLQKMYGKDVDFEAIRKAELTADLIGDYLFTDRKFVEELSVQKPNIFKKIYEEIKYLVKTFTGSKEARQLEQVKRQFDKLYKQTSNATDGIKYNVDNAEVGNNYSYEELTKKDDITIHSPSELNLDSLEIPSEYSWETDEGRKAIRKIAKATARKNIELYNENGNSRTLINNELGEVTISNEALNHGLDKEGNLNATAIMPAYFENAIVVNEADGRRKDAVKAYVLMGAYKDGDNINIVRMIVNEYERGKTLEKHEYLGAIREGGNAIKKEDTSMKFAAQQKPKQYLQDESSQVSVKEMLDFVKKNFPNELSIDVSQKLGYTRGESDIEGLRYSLTEDNKGRKLSKEQQEYFKDSKVVDDNGNLIEVYHGTRKADFTVFNRNHNFFTDSQEMASSYAPNSEMYSGYLNIKNPFVIDAQGEKWSKIAIDNEMKALLEQYGGSVFKEAGKWRTSTADIVALVEDMVDEGEADYDGVIIKNVEDTGSYGKGLTTANDYITFKSNQFKNNDNAAPTSSPDIRYSISEDNQGRKLSKEQKEYFKDSKAVDENGKLVTVYHGSPDYGFTVFNNSKSDDGMSFFFTNDSDMANSYVGDKDKLYEVYLNLKNPYVVDAKGHKWNQIRLDENDDVITGKVERFVDLSMRYDVEIDFGSVSESLGYLSDSVEYMLQDEMDNLDEGETSLYTEAEKEELRQLAAEIDSTYESWDEEAHLDEDGEPTNFAQYLRDHQLSTKYTTRKIAKIAKEQGNDGVIIKNVYDNGKFHRETGIQGFGDVYIAFDSNQIKRVDNTNPTTNADIRYSLSENTGTLDDDIDAMWDAFTTEDWDEILGTSWITELGYNVVEEETTVKATEEMQNEEEDKPRYKGDTSTVGKKAKLTDERIERLFSAYGANDPKYAKAYVTSIHPRDFLSLTLSDSSFEKWDDAANKGVDEELFPLDIDKLKRETQTPYLIVDTSTGRVTGHEGRHRMRALLEAGVTEVPIAIEDIRTKYSKEKEASMFISSQEYSKGYVNNNFGTEIKNLIPLNKIYREEILASYGGKGDINYSLSNQNENIAPVGSYNVYGRDIALKTTEPAVTEDIAPVREVAELPTPLTEEMANERDAEQQNIDTLDNAPEEIEAPYYAKDEDIKLEDPFDERDIKDVGKRNVKAYMYENPEVKPYFQQEAQAMLWELQNSVKGEKNFNSQLYYDTNGELGWFGTTRETSDDIAYLLDNFKYTYADIEKGLKAIIEDRGAENNAISKRIEFALNDRLKDGYTDFMSGEDVPANQDYVNLLMDKQINTYSDEAYYEWLQSLATEEAPPLAPLEPSTDDRDIIAPVREDFDTPEGTQRVMDFENEQIVDEQETPKRKTHGEVQKGYVDNIKKKFEERGLDFDKVLEKAKNKSTFASVDNTPQRYIEKTFGYKEGQLLNDLTINQEALNESKAIKWLNSFTNRKDGELARLSKKYGIKPNSKEDAAAQMYAEGFYVNDNNEYMAYGDNELAMDFPDVRTQERIKGLANEPRIREIYDNTLAEINESRIRNGFPEIPKRDNYFLHFRAMDDTFSKLGIPFNPNDIRAKDLPTDINGMTADLRPNQPYFASANQRKGLKTSHSLLGGMERYLTSAKNQIYHIDDIQTLRGLRNYVADMYGQAHGLESLNEMTPEEAEARVKEVYDAHLSTFAKFLNEQANVLAGKTSLIDRGLEGIIGRRGIQTLNTINSQVAKNMVGFNVSSALTNFVSGVQGFAKANKFDAVKAFAQTASNKINSIFGKSDGFAENDPAIIRRKGAEKFYRTPVEKVSDVGYTLMSAVDDVTTEFLIRTKYNELTRKGMDSEKAHIEAGKWAMRILGDRSLGQQPQLYNSKMLGLITKFQLEVRNQLDSMFYDTIQEANADTETIRNGTERNAKKAAKIASTMVQLAVFQHLFGKAFESVAGYNPTFDIVSTLIKLLGLDDEEDDEDTVLDNVEQAFLELAGDMPYSSLFTGGRFPIESALPIAELVKGVDEYGNEKSRVDTLTEAAPYWLNPFGGTNQIKKTIKGLNMFDESLPVAGSYTDSGNLRFPVEDTTANRIQAAIFGQWANENARDYINNERQPLKEKQIQEFADLDIPIQEYWEYREGLKEQKTIDEKFDYIAGLDLPVSKKNILINNVVDREEEVDLINYDDFSGYEEFDFATKNPEKYEFFKNNNISYADYSASEESKEAYSWAYKNPEKYVVSKAIGDVVQYKQYTKELNKLEADIDEDGKSISGSRKAKVINYINNMDADYGAKIILYKMEYSSDDTYNNEIIEYLNRRNDISYAETVTILTELGFTVEADGTVRWE